MERLQVNIFSDVCSSNNRLFVLCIDNTDYVSVAASLQWLTPEDSSILISIDIINDNITEGEENFTLALSSASPEVSISPSSAVITILDEDSQGISAVLPRAPRVWALCNSPLLWWERFQILT